MELIEDFQGGDEGEIVGMQRQVFEKLEPSEFGDHGGDVTDVAEQRKTYRYSKMTSWALGL